MNRDFINSIVSNKLIYWNTKSIELSQNVLLKLITETLGVKKSDIEEDSSQYLFMYKGCKLYIGVYEKFTVFVGEKAEYTMELYMEFSKEMKGA